MTKSGYEAQVERILRAGEKGDADLRTCDLVRSILHGAEEIEPGAPDWIPLARLGPTNIKMFNSLADASEWRVGRDARGQIYVCRDHALHILSQELALTKKLLAEYRYFCGILGAVLAVAIVGRFVS